MCAAGGKPGAFPAGFSRGSYESSLMRQEQTVRSCTVKYTGVLGTPEGQHQCSLEILQQAEISQCLSSRGSVPILPGSCQAGFRNCINTPRVPDK